MAFALTLVRLIELLEQPGCPICRRRHDAAKDAVDMLLWEHVNDPAVRMKILAGSGFCAAHTRMLVATELSNSGTTLGVNIIYEHLGRELSRELHALEGSRRRAGRLRRWIERLPKWLQARTATAVEVKNDSERCIVCQSSDMTAQNALFVLFETFEKGAPDVIEAYYRSDGLCQEHLRAGIRLCTWEYPEAARRLTANAVERLGEQSAHMREYIRKNNWEYRHEKITESERRAWLNTLVFCTGLPAEAFSHKIKSFEE